MLQLGPLICVQYIFNRIAVTIHIWWIVDAECRSIHENETTMRKMRAGHYDGDFFDGSKDKDHDNNYDDDDSYELSYTNVITFRSCHYICIPFVVHCAADLTK